MAVTVTLDSDAFATAGNGQYRVHGTIAFDSSYPTGGETLTPSDFGLRRLDDIQLPNTNGYGFEYDKTNTKLKVYLAGGESTLNVTYTTATSVATETATLASYSLPGGTLASAGQGIRIKAWGTTAASTFTKTVSLVFGTATVVASPANAANATDWELWGIVIRTGAATQEAVGGGQSSATQITVDQSNPSQTLSGDITVAAKSLSGTGATTGSVVLQGFTVNAFSASGAAGAANGAGIEVPNANSLASLTGVRFEAYGG